MTSGGFVHPGHGACHTPGTSYFLRLSVVYARPVARTLQLLSFRSSGGTQQINLEQPPPSLMVVLVALPLSRTIMALLMDLRLA
jgi:hypothetical protein